MFRGDLSYGNDDDDDDDDDNDDDDDDDGDCDDDDEIRSVTCLKLTEKDACRKLAHAATGGWGVLQLCRFREGDVRIRDFLAFLHRVQHPKIKLV